MHSPHTHTHTHTHAHSAENITWSSKLKPVVITEFKGSRGPRMTLASTIKSLFLIFFSTSVIDEIVMQSNKYVEQCLGEAFANWDPITTEELHAYMGFMILMGIVKLPTIYSPVYTTRQSGLNPD